MDKMEEIVFESELLDKEIGKVINRNIRNVNKAQEEIEKLKNDKTKLEGRRKTDHEQYEAINDQINKAVKKKEKEIHAREKSVEEYKNEIRKKVEEYKKQAIKESRRKIHEMKKNKIQMGIVQAEAQDLKRTITGIKNIEGVKSKTYENMNDKYKQKMMMLQVLSKANTVLFEEYNIIQEALEEFEIEVEPKLSNFLEIKTPKETQAEPEVTEPETVEPEVAEPETVEPEPVEPEPAEPEPAEPETVEPETTEPETTEPETVEPEVAEPETEDRRKSAYPQEIIDAFDKFDKLCDEVKSEFEKQENVDNERKVYERDFETKRTEWKTAIDNKEEIDVKEIQEKYVDLDKRLTVYKENIKKYKACREAAVKKVEQAKTIELKKKAAENLYDIINDKLDEVIEIVEKFDGTPIDVSEMIKLIEAYTVPGQIDLDPPESNPVEEISKKIEAHDRARKANEDFQKDDKITPVDKKAAMENMTILDLHLPDIAVSTEVYIKECDDFINEIKRIKEEQKNLNPDDKKEPTIYEIASIRVNAKNGVYEFTFTNGDVLKIDTKALYERETDTNKEWTREYAGRSEKRKVWKSWNDDKENQATTPEPEKGLLIKGENMLELRHMIGQLINKKGFLENSQSITAGSFGKVNSEVAKKLDANAQSLIDPIIEEILRLIDEINAKKDKKSQYANQMKYHDALKEQGEDTIKIEYDTTEIDGLRLLGIEEDKRTEYIKKIKKEAEKQGKLGLFKGGKEQETETKTELHYKDLSEGAKRVYNNVVTLSKEEKKAQIEEEALKGHITLEDHRQLHEIFGLGPLPVAEKETNILKRASNGLKDKVSALFHRRNEEKEQETETKTELHYKDLSERAKRVYNNVETLSKEEKKAQIEEEALKGHITPEEHQQLHDIFNLEPLPVAEKKPSIFKRVSEKITKGVKKTVTGIKEFFSYTQKLEKELEESEKENNSEDKEEDNEGRTTEADNQRKNIEAIQKLSAEYKSIYSSLTDDIDKDAFKIEFLNKVANILKNAQSDLGKKGSYVENCNEISRNMKNFVQELEQKRIVEIAMDIQLNGEREEKLSTLSPDRQSKVIRFLDSRIKPGLYYKDDLERMKGYIDAQIGMGVDAEELYEKLNINEIARDVLNVVGQRDD